MVWLVLFGFCGRKPLTIGLIEEGFQQHHARLKWFLRLKFLNKTLLQPFSARTVDRDSIIPAKVMNRLTENVQSL